MTDLRTAAQRALEALEWHYRQGHSNTIGGFRLKIDEKALRELRAALAQQAEPLNLRDPAVQKRLATQWGYVPAAQAEPVEPAAWIESPHGAIRANPNYKFTFPSQLLHWQIPLYTAPPQLQPLTEEEIYRATGYCGVSKYTAITITRAVERAHGIKE